MFEAYKNTLYLVINVTIAYIQQKFRIAHDKEQAQRGIEGLHLLIYIHRHSGCTFEIR